MMRIPIVIAAALLALSAGAQNSQIVATNLAYFGGAKVTGQACFSPTDQNGNPINLTTPAGQQLAPSLPLCYPIVNGVLSVAAAVPDTSQANPVNACIKATIYNLAQQQVGTYPCLQPQGSTWSWDAYVPSAIPATTALSLPQFQLNGTLNQSQGYLNISCPSCTNVGGTVTIPAGAATTYTAPGTGAYPLTIAAKFSQTVSVKDYGAVGDGAHLAADSTALTAAVAAANVAGQKVYIPAGHYLLNNSAAAALSGANNIVIYGDGASTVLSCNTVGAADCIASTGATNFGLRDLSINFTPAATTRTSGYAVNVQSCNGCDFENLTLSNGDLSGMRLASSSHTTIRDLAISNFYANGLFTLNNQDLRVEGVSCTNNQDACFETSWYDSQYSTYSIPCQGITATNITSNNDTEAILINSCLDVVVDGFSAIGSGKEAVFVGQDPTTTTAHWPDRVSVSNGNIYGAGYGTNANNSVTAEALYVNVVTSPGTTKSHLVFSNINATHIAGWGLAMAELQNDDVQMANVKFYDVGQAPNSGGTGVYAGCLQTEGNEVNLDNVSCSTVGTYGLYDTNTNRLTGSNLVLNASNQQGTGINALYLPTTATGYVSIQGVNVKDTNATTWSSDIYDGSPSGQHQILNISLQGTVTPIGPTSVNGNTTYTWSDPTHSWVLRNGGTIESFAPPNVYVEPTAGTTSSSQVNGAVFYLQSKCRATPSSAEQVESAGWGIIYPTLTTESLFINRLGGCGFPLVLDTTTATTLAANLITGTSVNNVAIATPAAQATLDLFSGITFTVQKTMNLTCTACGTYNLDSFGAASGAAVFYNLNNVFFVDGFTTSLFPGIGQGQVAWTSGTNEPLCQSVSYSAASYLAVAAGNGSVTPGTNTQVWWPIGVNYTPQQLDCAYYYATAQAQSAGAKLTLRLGNTGYSTPYYTNLGLAAPSSQSQVNIEGAGRGFNGGPTLIKAGQAVGYVISTPDQTGSLPYGLRIANLMIDGGGVAGCLNIAGEKVGLIEHIGCQDWNYTATADPVILGGSHSAYQNIFSDIFVQGQGSPANDAVITASGTGSTLTFAISGGTTYVNAPAHAFLWGFAHGAKPCTTVGGLSTTYTGSGPYTLTGISQTGTWAGCAGPYYVSVPDIPANAHGMFIQNNTDCTTNDLQVNNAGYYYAIQYSGVGNCDMFHEHTYSPSGLALIYSPGGNNRHFGAELDSYLNVGALTGGTGTGPDVWIGTTSPNSTVTAGQTMFSDPSNTAFTIRDSGCNNSSTSTNAFNLVVTGNGPIPHGGNFGNITVENSVECDTLTTENSIPAPLTAPGVVSYLGSTAGSADAYTLANALIPTLQNGLEVKFLPSFSNATTTPTLNIAGIGAVTLTKLGHNPLTAADLTTTAIADVIYDGTYFELQNPQSNTFNAPLTAPAFWPQSVSAGPYATYFDDFFTTNGMTSQTIGTTSGASCSTSTTYLDNTSPGNISAVSGTGGSGTGIDCVGAGGALWLYDAATAPNWTWETRVLVPVLPGTTAGSYQAGMAHTWAASPWATSAIGFYLSSANGTANNWYCEYYAGSTSTITNSTVAAAASTWTRLSLVDDGTYVHWYINGTEATPCKTAVGSMPTTAISSAWTSVAGSSTSVTMAIDYVAFHEAVTR